MLSMATTQDVVEMFSFAWEIFGLLAFVCEEAIQACTMGIASALNKGRVDLADFGMYLLEEGIIGVYAMYSLYAWSYAYPPAQGLFEFLRATSHFTVDAHGAIIAVEAMPGRRRYPFFLPYGRFF